MSRGSDDDVLETAALRQKLLQRKVRMKGEEASGSNLQEEINRQAREAREEMLESVLQDLIDDFASEKLSDDEIRLERQENAKDVFSEEDEPHWSVYRRAADLKGLALSDYQITFRKDEQKIAAAISWGKGEQERAERSFSLSETDQLKDWLNKTPKDFLEKAQKRLVEAFSLQSEVQEKLLQSEIRNFSPGSPASRFLEQIGEEIFQDHPFVEGSFSERIKEIDYSKRGSESPLLRVLPEKYQISTEHIPRGPGEIAQATIVTPDGIIYTAEDISETGAQSKADQIIKSLADDEIRLLQNREANYLAQKDIFKGLDTAFNPYDHRYRNRVIHLDSDLRLNNPRRHDTGDFTIVTGTMTFSLPKSEQSVREFRDSGYRSDLETKEKEGDTILIFSKGRLVSNISSGIDRYQNEVGAVSRILPGLRARLLKKKALERIDAAHDITG